MPTLKLNCATCEVEFYTLQPTQKCCSKECRRLFTNHKQRLYNASHQNIIEKRGKICKTCGGNFLGHDKNKYCSQKCRKTRGERRKSYSQQLKKKLVDIHGGKCACCNKEYNQNSFCFHHLGDKLFTLDSNTLSKKRWNDILKESEKCDLLCHNCHAITHENEKLKDRKEIKKESQYKKTKGFLRKKKLVELKGGKCELCGWESDFLATYSFNHLTAKNFELNRSKLACRSWESILQELEKCRLECLNCHISKNVNKNHERQV